MQDFNYELLKRLYEKNSLEFIDIVSLGISDKELHFARRSINDLVSVDYVQARGYLDDFTNHRSETPINEAIVFLRLTEKGKEVYLEMLERKKPWYLKNKSVDRIVTFLSGLFTGLVFPLAYDFIINLMHK